MQNANALNNSTLSIEAPGKQGDRRRRPRRLASLFFKLSIALGSLTVAVNYFPEKTDVKTESADFWKTDTATISIVEPAKTPEGDKLEEKK